MERRVEIEGAPQETSGTPGPTPRPATAIRTATVLIDGPWRQSLAVVRSLGRAGIRCVVVHRRGSEYVERSRWVTDTIDPGLPLSAGRERARAIVTAVDALPELSDEGPIFYYPIGDKEIAFSLAVEAEFPDHWIAVHASRETIEICADKARTAASADAAGLPGIHSITAADRDALQRAAETIGFPCLVKGNNEEVRLHHRKAFIIGSAEELARTFADWEPGPHPLLVQTYFDGPRVNVYFFAVEGRMVASAAVEILRTDVPDGTGLAVEGVSLPNDSRLTEYTRALVAELDYHGAGCAQFLVDGTKRDGVFLEVNARLGANYAAVAALGLDLPRLSVALATGEPIEPLLPKEIPVGRRYAWTTGDVLGWCRAVVRRDVGLGGALRWAGRIVRTALRADDHITWDRRDRAPTWRIITQRLFPWRDNPTL